MRFLVDECTGTRVADWLREEGYEVFSVYDQARGISDDVIINKAFDENWILITNDKDFGEKVHREKCPHRGIIFLRLQDERSTNKISILQRLLSMYLQRIPDSFVVVTEKQVRFRTTS
jgi:predicted nuclease of predicted toxin-antitoxin system